MVTSGPNFVKTLAAHAFILKFSNNNHIGILALLLTETKLVTTENPGLLPLRSHESETGRNWGHDTAVALTFFLHYKRSD